MANTITIGIDGGLRTIEIHLEANQTKADDTLDDAARWLYTIKGLFHFNDGGDPPIDKTYDDLTNPQKLQVFLKGIVWVTKHWAKNKYISGNIAIAQTDITTEADDKYDIGNV